MEESLRKSENKYRLLAETAREIILLFDSNLHISYANAAWKRISGYLLSEMTDMVITDMIPQEQQQAFTAKILPDQTTISRTTICWKQLLFLKDSTHNHR